MRLFNLPSELLYNTFTFLTNEEIINCLKKLKLFNGKVFLEIKIKKGFRDDLGRPKTTPQENKKHLMKFIKKT